LLLARWEPKETIYAMRFGGFTGPVLDHEQEILNDYECLNSWNLAAENF
jgi:hypothetical protein